MTLPSLHDKLICSASMVINHLFLTALFVASTFQQFVPAITSPSDGQTLSEVVSIRGTVEAVNFSFAELAFGYMQDTTDTWFLIQIISQPPQDDFLAAWDTTGLTGGNYRLRLRVYSSDGSHQDAFVNDLHLRDVLISAATPTQTTVPSTSTPVTTPTIEAKATGTAPVSVDVLTTLASDTPPPLPTNPAAYDTTLVFSMLGRGALLALILFTTLGLFIRVRRS